MKTSVFFAFFLGISSAFLMVPMHMLISRSINPLLFPYRHTYTILVLGEDTTAEAAGNSPWPEQLQIKLNKNRPKNNFRVLNKGMTAGTSTDIVAKLPEFIKSYNPDIVISMMGINDVFYRTAMKRTSAPLQLGIFPIASAAETPEDIILIARTKKDAEKFEEGETLLISAITSHPTDRLYQELGLLYDRWKKFEQAVTSYKKALEINPKNDKVYIDLGNAYRHLGKIELSMSMYHNALDINPQNDFAFLGLGLLYKRDGQYDKAARMYEQATRLNPTNVWAYMWLASAYRQLGQFEKSEQTFTHTMGLFSDTSDPAYRAIALTEFSRLYRQTGNEKETDALESKIRELNPSAAKNYQQLYEILKNSGIRLVAVQYPLWRVGALKDILYNDQHIVYVDMRDAFQKSIEKDGYEIYFLDRFFGDFGYATAKGNELIAETVSNTVLTDIFR